MDNIFLKQICSPGVAIGLWLDPPAELVKQGMDSEYIPVVAIGLSDEGEPIPLVLDTYQNRLVPFWMHSLLRVPSSSWSNEGLVYRAEWEKFQEGDEETEADPETPAESEPPV